MSDYGLIATIGADGFNSVDWASQNKGVTPIFTKIPVYNEYRSERENRAVYDDVEVVLIYIAGDGYSIHSAPVDESVKRRFPEAYAHWKRTEEGRMTTGTPLRMWPMATPAFIKELEAINVFSVDDLASIADVFLDKMSDGRVWRERARDWLNSAKDSAVENRFAAENEKLKERIAALEAGQPSIYDEELKVKPQRVYRKKGPRYMTPEHRQAASDRFKAMWAKRRAEKAARTA